MTLILITTSIMQLIGLLRKNHFLLIPYILTTTTKILYAVSIIYILFIFTGFHIIREKQFYFILFYIFATIYFIIANCILYMKFSKKYNLELRASKLSEPAMTYSELVDDCDGASSIVGDYSIENKDNEIL